MMKLLLLKLPYAPHPETDKPDDFRTQSSFRPVPSLALAALGGFARRYAPGWEVEAIDLNIEAYALPSLPIDTARYPALLKSALRNSEYDVLGLSAMFVYNCRWVADAVRLSREFHPNARIILGGGYPTMFPRKCKQEYGIEVISGEGEPGLLRALGLKSGKFPPDQLVDPADLPTPAWDLLHVKRYFERSGDRVLPFEASRGCPYGCTYCTVSGVWGRRVRYKRISQLLAEIKFARQAWGVEKIHFVDDNLTFNKQWSTRFLHRFLSMTDRPELAASNFSVKHLDEVTIDLLSAAGVKQFNVAVETGSKEMQKRINKRLDFTQVWDVVSAIKKRGLHAHICWMVGFPGETREQIEETFGFAQVLRAHSNQFLTVLPYPGTKLFEDAKREGLLNEPESLDHYDCRGGDYVKGIDYEWLRQEVYDQNIMLNFLNSPLMDEPGRFVPYLKSLVQRLPKHVIAHVILGYLGETEHYATARKLLRKPELQKTFGRYMDSVHPVMKAFRRADHDQPR